MPGCCWSCLRPWRRDGHSRCNTPATELWDRPEFLRTNYVISGAWALAFAVMVLAELALLYLPGLPPRAGVLAIILALVGAVKFTGWYSTGRSGVAQDDTQATRKTATIPEKIQQRPEPP
jgi:hypothetical protein